MCISERGLICVTLEMAWRRMLRAARVGKLAGQTRESPEQPDPVLYKQLVPPRTPSLSKNTCSCYVAPSPTAMVTLKYPASLTISTEITIFGVSSGFMSPAPRLWPDGGRLQASWSK